MTVIIIMSARNVRRSLLFLNQEGEMKGNKQSSIRFIIGTWDDKKQKGVRHTTLYRKTQVKLRGNLIRRKFGHIWLRVVYGKYKDFFGEMVEFYNEGVYKTLKDLKFALAAFIEQPLIDSLGKE